LTDALFALAYLMLNITTNAETDEIASLLLNSPPTSKSEFQP